MKAVGGRVAPGHRDVPDARRDLRASGHRHRRSRWAPPADAGSSTSPRACSTSRSTTTRCPRTSSRSRSRSASSCPCSRRSCPVLFGARVPVARALRETGVDAAAFGHGLIDRALGMLRGTAQARRALAAQHVPAQGPARAHAHDAGAGERRGHVRALDARRACSTRWPRRTQTWRYDVVTTFSQPVNADAVSRIVDARARRASVVDPVAVAYPSLQAADGSENERLVMFGVDLSTTLLQPKVSEGRWFTPGQRDEVVLSTDVIRDEPDLRVGRHDPAQGPRDDTRLQDRRASCPVSSRGRSSIMDRTAMDKALSLGGGVRRLQIATRTHDGDRPGRSSLMRIENKLKESGYSVASSTTKSRVLDSVTSEFGVLVVFLALMAGAARDGRRDRPRRGR